MLGILISIYIFLLLTLGRYNSRFFPNRLATCKSSNVIPAFSIFSRVDGGSNINPILINSSFVNVFSGIVAIIYYITI